MGELVRLENKEVITDTKIIAKQLGTENAFVMRVVRKLLEDYPDLRLILNQSKTEEYIEIQEREYRGRKHEVAFMNRQAFTLLVMRFETKKAREIQRRFNLAFYQMERYILKAEMNRTDPSWVQARELGKLGRIAETDTIKEFVEYATAQGSENAKFYYKHITNATYRALELIQHKQPKLRDTLSGLQVAWLMCAEHVANQSIMKHMAEKEHYKTIFVLVKQDIEKFAEGLMITTSTSVQKT